MIGECKGVSSFLIPTVARVPVPYGPLLPGLAKELVVFLGLLKNRTALFSDCGRARSMEREELNLTEAGKRFGLTAFGAGQ